MNYKIVLILVIVLAIAGTGFVVQQQTPEKPAELPAEEVQTTNYQALKMFPKSKVFSGYTLTDQNGQTFNQESFKGNWSVVFFGFTNCPDICPTTLLDMQKIHRSLSNDGVQPPRFVFVSVDSERDRPENM